MVSIVGYNQDAPGRAAAAQQPARHEEYNQGGSFGYDNIAGVQEQQLLFEGKAGRPVNLPQSVHWHGRMNQNVAMLVSADEISDLICASIFMPSAGMNALI